MKNKMISKLFVLACLGSVTTLYAQEEKRDTLNRELTLERQYNPTVLDANKVNITPDRREPITRKMAIDYASYGAVLFPEKEITLLPSGEMYTNIDYSKHRGYLNLAGGLHTNIDVDLGYHILDNQTDKLNLFFTHRSSNNGLDYQQNEEKVKAKLNDNLASIHFKHAFESVFFTLGGNFAYKAYNYFGHPTYAAGSSYTDGKTNSTADYETNQANTTIRFNTGLQSRNADKVNYRIDFDFLHFQQKYGLAKDYSGMKENVFHINGDLNTSLVDEDQRIGVLADIHAIGYNKPNGQGSYFDRLATYASKTDITLTPYYTLSGNGINLTLGAALSYYENQNDSQTRIAPHVAFDASMGGRSTFYFTADGGIKANDLDQLINECRFIDPSLAVDDYTKTPFDLKTGVKTGIIDNVWLNLYGQYKKTENDVFFVKLINSLTGNSFTEAMNPVNNFDTKLLRVGADLRFDIQKYMEFSIKSAYNKWTVNYDKDIESLDANEDLWASTRPDFEFGINATIHPLEKLSIGVDYTLMTGRKMNFQKDVSAIEMNNISELNLRGQYQLNDWVGAYAKITNLLNQEFDSFYSYPTQKIGAMIGININF